VIQPVTRRALELFVVCTLSACQDAPVNTDPVNTEPSPNASILPSPLASVRPLPLKDAGASSAPDAVAAGDAGLTDAATPRPPPSYFDSHRALESEVLPVPEAPGARLEAQFNWQPRSAGGRGDPRGRFGLRIELSSLGRMRLSITSNRMPLAENTELRARLDRYGHVLVWPDHTGYRVVLPGTLRAIFEELRADVSPLLEAKTERAGGGKLLGLPVHVDTIQTAMGTLVLEQAQVGDLGESGILLCRLLSELVLAKPDNSACRTDWVPLKAEFGWVENGRFGFIVNTLERDPAMLTAEFSTPPEGGDFRNHQLPDKPPRLWLDEDAQRRIEPGAKVRATPSDAKGSAEPTKGLVVINHFETPRYLLLNGEVSAWLATGAELQLMGLRPGSYTLLARDFFGLEPEHPLVQNVPGQRALGTPTHDEDMP
jgi:hypothetical protein